MLAVDPFSQFLLALILVILIGYFHFRHRNLPPGPTGLPLVGYSPFFGSHPQDTFLELGKKYGKIISLYMGPNLAIVLNDYDTIKAAFVGQADLFAGRPDSFVFRYLSTGDDGQIHGITMSEGEIWKTTRRFMLQTFRDLGMGKSAIQDRILDEAAYLTDIFAQHHGEAFDPFRTLFSSVSNVICILCYGQRFPHDDANFKGVLRDLDTASASLAQAGPLQGYPFLRFLPGKMKNRWKIFCGTAMRTRKFTRDMVDEHKLTYSYTDTRDYIDAFLHQQHRTAETGIQPAFKDDELLVNLRAFFGAGTETTSTTLNWILLFTLHNPDVQKKIHDELDNNIGREKLVTVEDRVKVPYLEAVIREVQRLANVTPFGVLRANIDETVLLGYRIPKRTFIMPNFKSVNMDPKLWPEPHLFKPERFLTEQGKLSEPPYFMPFSTGKRACVGEALARMEIFLFFANIMQRFDIRTIKDGSLPPTTSYVTSISCRPLPFQMEAIPRQ